VAVYASVSLSFFSHWSLPLSHSMLRHCRLGQRGKPLRKVGQHMRLRPVEIDTAWPFAAFRLIARLSKGTCKRGQLWILAILGQWTDLPETGCLPGALRVPAWSTCKTCPQGQGVDKRYTRAETGLVVRSSHRNSCKSVDKRFDSSHVLVRAQVFARVAKSTTSLLSRPFLCIN
jgi:hypothetical protein